MKTLTNSNFSLSLYQAIQHQQLQKKNSKLLQQEHVTKASPSFFYHSYVDKQALQHKRHSSQYPKIDLKNEAEKLQEDRRKEQMQPKIHFSLIAAS